MLELSHLTILILLGMNFCRLRCKKSITIFNPVRDGISVEKYITIKIPRTELRQGAIDSN